jgi:hypothetical protein
MNHGGKRAGAGRPPLAPGTHKVKRSLALAPSTDAVIRAHLVAGETYGTTLDRIVREWVARRD